VDGTSTPLRTPLLERSITLQFQGDWGGANLHRVCGWLAQELGDRTGPYTRIAIWTGRGGADGVRAVGRGIVDVGLTTPAAFAMAALDGRGIYAGERYPHLRAVGVVPQRDRLVVAVARDLGIGSMSELRASTARLRLATAPHDGVNNIGWAAHELLTRCGVPPDLITSSGGAVLEGERPMEAIERVRRGEANVIAQEAVMAPDWQRLAAERPLTFLPPEPAVLAGLERDLGWPAADLPAGYFPGLAEPLHTLDFSDFLLVVREDLPADIAYLLAWCLVERRQVLEAQYRHIPPERSPVSYPLDPVAVGTTPIPLHPGAAAYFASLPSPVEA
jgi:uncharacterized protein